MITWNNLDTVSSYKELANVARVNGIQLCFQTS